MIELTDEQNELLMKLDHWFTSCDSQYFSYSGCPGTGKTTVVRFFIDRMGLKKNDYICCAYTGKASMVLARSGLDACTIHSLIYYTRTEYIKNENGEQVIKDNGEPKTKLAFVKKEALNESLKLIIVDEATMVNDKLKEEILSFGIPVIFIGDRNQLPPIFGISSVMLNPDFILTKIMRQAEGDPIVMFCQKILKDEPIEIGIYGRSRVLRVMDYRKNLLLDYDIIICGKNMTRDNINNHARYDILKRKDGKPQIGDKIICRQNNWEREVDGIYLINGMIGYIDNIDYSTCDGHKVIIDFCPEFLTKGFDSLELDYRYMMASLKEKTEFGISQYNKFEYGYCITAHLSQGSQYSKVLYIDEHFWDREMTKKLRYTAISRAIDSIDIVTSYNGLR